MLDKFFEIETALLTEVNSEDKKEWEWQLEGAKHNIIVDSRRHLISDKNNNLPILGIITGQKFREITDLLFEEDYITNGIFDEELRLEKNYFDQEMEENDYEETDKNGKVE